MKIHFLSNSSEDFLKKSFRDSLKHLQNCLKNSSRFNKLEKSIGDFFINSSEHHFRVSFIKSSIAAFRIFGRKFRNSLFFFKGFSSDSSNDYFLLNFQWISLKVSLGIPLENPPEISPGTISKIDAVIFFENPLGTRFSTDLLKHLFRDSL